MGSIDESDSDDYDGDEDLEEEGMDWDDLAREAAADDRKRGVGDDNDGGSGHKRKQRRHR